MHAVKENFNNRLRERLYSLSTTIPTEAVISGDVEGCLKQVRETELRNSDDDKIVCVLASFHFRTSIKIEPLLALISFVYVRN